MSDSNRSYRLAVLGAAVALTFIALGLGAYFGSLYGPTHKQYNAVDANQTGNEAYQGVTNSLPDIALIPEPVERAIANPPPSSGEDHEQRDLAAQESMAAWAFWMAFFSGITTVITSAGTFLIWRQVKLTREAVEDTGKATMAMERQNDLTEIAQRPWLKIEATVSHVERTVSSFTVRCDITVTNVGKTVAQNCAVRTALMWYEGTPRGDAKIRDTRDEADKAVMGFLPEGRQAYPLLPGESVTVSSQHLTGGVLKGEINDNGEERLYFVVFAAARYQIPGQEIVRETDRAFCFTYTATGKDRNDPFQNFGIPLPLPNDVSRDTVWMMRAGHNRTT